MMVTKVPKNPHISNYELVEDMSVVADIVSEYVKETELHIETIPHKSTTCYSLSLNVIDNVRICSACREVSDLTGRATIDTIVRSIRRDLVYGMRKHLDVYVHPATGLYAIYWEGRVMARGLPRTYSSSSAAAISWGLAHIKAPPHSPLAYPAV